MSGGYVQGTREKCPWEFPTLARTSTHYGLTNRETVKYSPLRQNLWNDNTNIGMHHYAKRQHPAIFHHSYYFGSLILCDYY